MVTNRKAGVGVVTEGGAQSVLRRGTAKELAQEEEKVMRMRLGASPPRSAPLERAGQGLTDVEIEVLALEIEAWMKWKASLAERQDRARTAVPSPSRTKEKIIRALRKKG
jgi:hypothetical protein